MRAFVFPGQGTQRVGMGQYLYHRFSTARDVFEKASEILGRDIAGLCFRGPAVALTDTRNTQVAVFTCNAAALAVLQETGQTPDVVAGHSVGELSALWAAGVLSFGSALKTVQHRAKLMASVSRRGAMAAIIGLTDEDVQDCCRRASWAGCVVIGLYNAPHHTVVSGERRAVEVCGEIARTAGALRVMPLPVSTAFHSPLMEEIRQPWHAHVAGLRLSEPAVPVVVNATGGLASETSKIGEAMVDQMTSPVRWVDSVRWIAAHGVRTLIEVGDSKVLCSFNRAIESSMESHSLSDPRSIDRLRHQFRNPVPRRAIP